MKKHLSFISILATLSFSFCFSFYTLSQTLPSYLPTDGLVAYYPFNGNANDESGNGNNGTVNGATLTADRSGISNSAFSFNGSNNFIEGTFTNFPLNSMTRSVTGWVKLNGINGTIKEFIISWGTGSGNGLWDNNGYGVYIEENLNAAGIWLDWGGSHIHNFNFTPNTYYFLSSTINDSLIAKFYINGELIGIHDVSGINTLANGNAFNIGKSTHQDTFGGWTGYINGTLDDIAIYNRALTQEEITALYTGTPVNGGGGGSTTSNPVPPGIPYQAVVRNSNGQVAANTAVTAKFTLHQNTTDGAVEYQETHALTTNAQGLISTVLGQGTAVQGTFAGINWANTTKFMQVEMDLGNGFVDMGTQQLMSVPYALYAANGPQGAQGPAGPTGPQGPAGAAGPTGISVSSVVTSGNNFIITFSDGSTQTTPIPSSGSTNSGSNSNTLIYTITGF
jgi:hypothetical protein